MAIYTKTGDQGETSLANGQRVSKTDARIEAYGTADELNSWIGLLRATYDCEQLQWIQNKLFNLGAALSEAPGEWLTEDDVHQLERWIDALQNEIPPMHAFVLPSGSEAASRCHVCRTVCRRTERRMIEAECTKTTLQFVNRLSDFLFVLARFLNTRNEGVEEVWKR